MNRHDSYTAYMSHTQRYLFDLLVSNTIDTP